MVVEEVLEHWVRLEFSQWIDRKVKTGMDQ